MYVVGSIDPQGSAQRSRRDNRKAILITARILFARRGLAGVTFDDIASGTGLTRRTIYNHFANVDDLFAASMRFAIERLGRNLPAPPASDDDLLASLERYLGELLAFFGSDSYADVHLALVRHGGAHPLLQRSLHSQIMEPLQRSLEAWLSRGHRVGAAHRIADDMVALALGLAESARLLNRSAEDTEHHVPPLARAFAHILAQPQQLALGRVA